MNPSSNEAQPQQFCSILLLLSVGILLNLFDSLLSRSPVNPGLSAVAPHVRTSAESVLAGWIKDCIFASVSSPQNMRR